MRVQDELSIGLVTAWAGLFASTSRSSCSGHFFSMRALSNLMAAAFFFFPTKEATNFAKKNLHCVCSNASPESA